MTGLCNAKDGLRRGAWTPEEDRVLASYIRTHGPRKWSLVPKKTGLNRCGKSCRLRWLNYLRPDIKRGNISPEEEDLIIRLHRLLGNRWSLIAGRLPGRTDNEIKNYWNTVLKKKKMQVGEERPPLGQENESLVVRTKATRCTTTFLDHEPKLHEISVREDRNGSSSGGSLPSLDTSLFFNEEFLAGELELSGEEQPCFSWELGLL